MYALARTHTHHTIAHLHIQSAQCPLVCICTVCFNLHGHTVRVKRRIPPEIWVVYYSLLHLSVYCIQYLLRYLRTMIGCAIGGSLVLGLVIITFLVAVLILILMCRWPNVPGGFVHSWGNECICQHTHLDHILHTYIWKECLFCVASTMKYTLSAAQGPGKGPVIREEEEEGEKMQASPTYQPTSPLRW